MLRTVASGLVTLARTAGAVTLTAMLAVCGNNSLDQGQTAFHVRSLNLVKESPTLEIDVDDTSMFTDGYGRATRFTAGDPGQHTLSFSAILPPDLRSDDETATRVSGASAYTFLAGTEYTVVAYGTMDDLRTFIIEGLDQREHVDDDKLVLQFTHASPDTPAVDVYVTAVKAGITSRYYVDTLSLTETSDPLELSLIRSDDNAAGNAALSADVVIELLAAGTSDLLYRSNALTFAEQNRVMMAIASDLELLPVSDEVL